LDLVFDLLFGFDLLRFSEWSGLGRPGLGEPEGEGGLSPGGEGGLNPGGNPGGEGGLAGIAVPGGEGGL